MVAAGYFGRYVGQTAQLQRNFLCKLQVNKKVKGTDLSYVSYVKI